jgi:hypothetical protein
MLSGHIKPTHMLAVMSKLPVSSMIVHEALTPRFCTRNAAASVSIPVSGNGPRPGAYDWTSWPHSPQRELEIACERLAGLKGEVANRTAWAMQIERDLQEKIAWGVQLGKQVEEWSAWGLQLEKQLEERTAWALQLEKRAEETAGEALRISNELADLNLQMEGRTRWALSLQQETEDLKTHSLQLSKDLDRLAWARPFDRRFHASLHSIYRGIRWVRDRLFGRAGH